MIPDQTLFSMARNLSRASANWWRIMMPRGAAETSRLDLNPLECERLGIPPEMTKALDMNERESFLGTDVGGTFTDLALITESGELHCFKVPSTPSQPGASILSGVEEIETTVAFEGSAWRRSLHTQRRKGADNPRT